MEYRSCERVFMWVCVILLCSTTLCHGYRLCKFCILEINKIFLKRYIVTPHNHVIMGIEIA